MSRLALPAEPSVAVLPFATIGGGGDVDYFSIGLTNDLITDLSKFHGLFVSASNSAFKFQGGAASVKEAAGKLGVRYVLNGSAQHSRCGCLLQSTCPGGFSRT
jgi:TolB-like protein